MKSLITLPFLLLTLLLSAQDVLPDVKVERMNGSQVSIIEEVSGNGKDITVINFWATWCKPCRNELENISYLYPDWQNDFNMEFIAVSIDDSRTTGQVKPYINSQGFEYKILLDANKEFFRAVNGTSPPLTLIVNSKGEILEMEHGYIEGNEYLLEEKLIEYSP